MPKSLVPLPERPCANCEAPFSPGRIDGRFCSKKCLRRFHDTLHHIRNRASRNQERLDRYHRNPEPTKTRSRAYHAAHREENNAKRKQRYEHHKPEHLAAVRAYRESNPEKVKGWARAKREKQPWLSCLRSAERRARQKKLDNDLTLEWAASVWTGRCAFTGHPFELFGGSGCMTGPSIDRINSAKGYVQSNCRFILFGINSLKARGTDEDVRRIAEIIVNSTPK